VIENQKNKRKYVNQRIFLHKHPSKGWSRNGVHSLLSTINIYCLTIGRRRDSSTTSSPINFACELWVPHMFVQPPPTPRFVVLELEHPRNCKV